MIKVKLQYLVNPMNISEMNEQIIKLIEFDAKDAGLKYDLHARYRSVLDNEFNLYTKTRLEYCMDYAVKTVAEIDGIKQETPYIVIEKEGKMMLKVPSEFNIPAEKMPELNNKLRELLLHEVELPLNKLSLSKLQGEDVRGLDFGYLKLFLDDDRAG